MSLPVSGEGKRRKCSHMDDCAQYTVRSDVRKNFFNTTIHHLFALSFPLRHPAVSQRTPWGLQTKKQSVPLTLKIEVIAALHISLSAQTRGRAGEMHQRRPHGVVPARAHGCTLYVADECSHLVSPGMKSRSRRIMNVAAASSIHPHWIHIEGAVFAHPSPREG